VKPRILFVHTVCPSQFSDLCEYLNASGLAQAWYMTTPGNLERNRSRYRNLVPLTPDGNMMAANKYYYSGKVERAGRIGLGLHRALTQFLKRQRIDLIVAHGSLGSPHFVFGEFGIPVITYIEFPCYADHGWDPKYPPTEAQRLIDKNMQMLSYYEVIRSERTLVPTGYARAMFPDYLQDKIVARFEGMDADKIAQREDCGVNLPRDRPTVGFAARDLSSAKGLESFMATVAELQQRAANVHFVIIGDPGATTYGYEQIFLERKYGKDSGVTFIEHLMRKFKVDREQLTLTGKLPYPRFSDLLHQVDLFLYPVMFGSGNWGLLELLIRGRPVVAARRCYVPEFIQDGVNGVLVDQDSPAAWADAVSALLADDQQRARLGDNALAAAQAYLLPQAAQDYLALFEEVIGEYRRG
tara:strand:- start:3465 stop:4700 length:1236 start_codon:yes stop_codon:yes gene_type:complete